MLIIIFLWNPCNQYGTFTRWYPDRDMHPDRGTIPWSGYHFSSAYLDQGTIQWGHHVMFWWPGKYIFVLSYLFIFVYFDRRIFVSLYLRISIVVFLIVVSSHRRIFLLSIVVSFDFRSSNLCIVFSMVVYITTFLLVYL